MSGSFKGLTDKYITSIVGGAVGLYVFDAIAVHFAAYEKDLTTRRLEKYRRHWNYYGGNHYPLQSEHQDKERRLAINLCAPLIDLTLDFTFGKPWKQVEVAGRELATHITRKVWDLSKRAISSYLMGQHGCVGGDAYLYIMWTPPTAEQKAEKKEDVAINNIRVLVLDPMHCHPKHDPLTREVTSAVIQYIDRPRIDGPNSSKAHVVRTIELTTQETVVWENEIKVSVAPNTIGVCPLVHISNFCRGNLYFGQSDMDGWLDPQMVFDETLEHYQEILRYHASPTTIVTGANLGPSLTRSPDNVWSGFHKDAKVFNLELSSDLAATNSQLDRLREGMHLLSQVPKHALGGLDNVADTSQAALETLYLPIIAKVRRKTHFYGAGILAANKIILQLAEKVFDVKINPKVPLYEKYDTAIAFQNPLPRDETRFVEMLIKKVESRLTSRASAVAALNEEFGSDLAAEIFADRASDMTEEIERARASSNLRYSPSLVGIAADSVSARHNLLDEVKVIDENINRVLRERGEISAALTDLDEEAATPTEKNPKVKPAAKGAK